MTDKLNQSLDEILKDRRQSARRPRPRRVANGSKVSAAVSAPVGGVKKATRAAKPVGKATAPTGPSGSGDSKIIVSNLPADVSESQIKDYFGKTIGPVKKVLLTYGPNGQSRGVSTIIFSKAGSAAEAAKTLDGVKVDGRPMKIEVVVNAKEAPAPPPVKTLGERISQPKSAAKSQPKPANATKGTASKGAGRGRGRGRGRNAGRGKPKTAEELDAEMQDYFEVGANGTAGGEVDSAMETNGGAAQPAATGGDTGMDDEIL